MRLKQRSLRGFVGPVSCVVALGLMGLVLACPTATFAFEANQKINFSVESIGAAASQELENKVTFDVEVSNPTETSDAQSADVLFGIDKEVSVETEDIATDGSSDVQFNLDKSIAAASEDVTAEESDEVYFNIENRYLGSTTNGNHEIDVTVEEFLSIVISNGSTAMDVAMEVDPTDQGATQTGSADFKVAGNNANGFSVYVNATNTSLTSASATNSAQINAIASAGTAVEDFASNTWGYNVLPKNATSSAVNSYNPISTIKQRVWYSEVPTNWVDLKLNCATKVNTQMPADTYSTDVVISAVAPFDSIVQP